MFFLTRRFNQFAQIVEYQKSYSSILRGLNTSTRSTLFQFENELSCARMKVTDAMYQFNVSCRKPLGWLRSWIPGTAQYKARSESHQAFSSFDTLYTVYHSRIKRINESTMGKVESAKKIKSVVKTPHPIKPNKKTATCNSVRQNNVETSSNITINSKRIRR